MDKEKIENKKVGLVAYLALAFALVFFSGVFSKATNWLGIFDFTILNGQFGSIVTDPKVITFSGAGGNGAKDGFLFGLGLLPSVMLALGVVNVVDYLGAMDAARQLLTPFFKPLLGLPGTIGLALIASLQSTDAGASMTKMLFEQKEIDDDQRTIFTTFQFSAGGIIVNFFSSGAALYALTNADKTPATTVPMIVPLAVMIILKLSGANMMRLYLKFKSKKSTESMKSVNA